MKLYLVQHGKAHKEDFDPRRPLTERGRADIERLGDILQQAGVSVQRIIHSGKLRAAESAQILGEILAPKVKLQVSDQLNPNEDPAAFDWLESGVEGDTLLVGHLPFMSRMVSHLVLEEDNRDLVAFQPGSMVCLELSEDSGWLIDWMMRPKLLY